MHDYRIRRATMDDIDQLVSLWKSLDMSANELEKSFTDFQIVEDSENKLVGAIAMNIVGCEGRIYSECLPDFSLSDSLRPLFWERLHSVARNNGLVRIWTDETAMFWKKDVGFAAVPEGRTQQLPAAFGSPRPGWLVLQLRGEEATPAAIEKQFEMILASQEGERAAAMRQNEAWVRQGKTLKTAATVFCVLLFLVSLIALVHVLTH